ncbi:hypothetical protein [Haloglomus litoreum]|uniref:hypothetical protein n=1 Tax=Haloglomus litoreum TaxID=3034026 RepID=UPI0023E7A667|nr:hypothetical protein [Haloglomus sp. DT116]
MSLAYRWVTTLIAGLVVLPVYLLGWVSDMNALLYFAILDSLLYSPVWLGYIADFLSSE